MFHPGRMGDSAGSEVTQQLMKAETSGLDIVIAHGSLQILAEGCVQNMYMTDRLILTLI